MATEPALAAVWFTAVYCSSVLSRSSARRILLFAIGTAGDVHPGIAIGRGLRERGHHVTFITNSYFEDAARRAGLEFESSGTVEEYLRTVDNPELWKFGKGFRVLFEQILSQIRPNYELIRREHRPGETIVVAPASAFGARLAAEKLGVPLVHLHLQPIVLRSRYEQPGVTVPAWFKPALRPLRQAWLAALDRWILDPALLPEFNAFRAELGLASLRRPFDGWIHAPEMVIGLFPGWFAPPQPDWPPQVRLTGFMLYDEGEVRAVPAGLREFLDAGSPPLVFALGTGMRNAREYFATSAEVCRRLGRRGILLTQTDGQVPDELPPGVVRFGYVPFSLLLARTALFTHHGGIGTMAQALRAGVPQLITPFNFDQPDNAARLKRLGVGDLIRPHRYEADRVAKTIAHLLDSPAVRERCREVAARFAATGPDPLEQTCRLIESVGSAHPNGA